MNTSFELTFTAANAATITNPTSLSPALPPLAGPKQNLGEQKGNKAGKRLFQASNRLAREWRTIETMVRIYCRDQHKVGGLCPECQGLLDYASVRLDRCRFGPEKPTCAKCPVHCYQKERRQQVRVVMRYAGPRMLWEHPILSLRHWVDGMKFFKKW